MYKYLRHLYTNQIENAFKLVHELAYGNAINSHRGLFYYG